MGDKAIENKIGEVVDELKALNGTIDKLCKIYYVVVRKDLEKQSINDNVTISDDDKINGPPYKFTQYPKD